MDKKIGIYKIENKENLKVYIGMSVDIDTRWKTHRRSLENNTHKNVHLQSAWNKYGEDNFEFSIIELCDKENLEKYEVYWISKLNSFSDKKGYNLTEGGKSINVSSNKVYGEKYNLVSRDYVDSKNLVGMSKDKLLTYYIIRDRCTPRTNIVKINGIEPDIKELSGLVKIKEERLIKILNSLKERELIYVEYDPLKIVINYKFYTAGTPNYGAKFPFRDSYEFDKKEKHTKEYFLEVSKHRLREIQHETNVKVRYKELYEMTLEFALNFLIEEDERITWNQLFFRWKNREHDYRGYRVLDRFLFAPKEVLFEYEELISIISESSKEKTLDDVLMEVINFSFESDYRNLNPRYEAF